MVVFFFHILNRDIVIRMRNVISDLYKTASNVLYLPTTLSVW